MSSRLLLPVVAACLLAALTACGGSGLLGAASNLLSQGQQALAAWEAAVADYDEAKLDADSKMAVARARPSPTTVGAARTSLTGLVGAAEEVVTTSRGLQPAGVGDGSQLADALQALSDARDLLLEREQELSDLLEAYSPHDEPRQPEPSADYPRDRTHWTETRWGRDAIEISLSDVDLARRQWASGLQAEVNLRRKNGEGIVDGIFARNFNQYVTEPNFPGSRPCVRQPETCLDVLGGPYSALFLRRNQIDGEPIVGSVYEVEDLTSSATGNATWLPLHRPYEFTAARQRVWGQGIYSAFSTHGEWRCFARSAVGRYCLPFYQDYRDFHAVSGGALYGEPPATGTWYGVAAAHETAQGILLSGSVDMTYSFADNDLDIEISDIKQVSSSQGFEYQGPNRLAWYDLTVDNDGKFRSDGLSIIGAFYGPSGNEAAGTIAHQIAVPSGNLATRNRIIGGFVAGQSN